MIVWSVNNPGWRSWHWEVWVDKSLSIHFITSHESVLVELWSRRNFPTLHVFYSGFLGDAGSTFGELFVGFQAVFGWDVCTEICCNEQQARSFWLLQRLDRTDFFLGWLRFWFRTPLSWQFCWLMWSNSSYPFDANSWWSMLEESEGCLAVLLVLKTAFWSCNFCSKRKYCSSAWISANYLHFLNWSNCKAVCMNLLCWNCWTLCLKIM